MVMFLICSSVYWVAPREGRVSRNNFQRVITLFIGVAPREGRVSRNERYEKATFFIIVAPREGRVSRNRQTHGLH